MRAQAVQTVTRRLVGQQTLSESSLWSRPGLLAVCIALPMIEVGLLWGVGLTSALVSAVLLMPWVGLLFGLAVMPVSWLFFVAVPPVLAVGLLIHHGVVRAGWSAPAARTTGWVALTFAVLTLSGAALSASPAGLRLPVAAAAGLFNAWAWNGIVNVLALAPQVPRRAVPLVPIALVLLLAVVAVGAGLGFRANVSHGASSLSRAP